ncbi:MAG: polynucleotide adenylyltransferase PcnB [Planctomycetota bacterium]
MGRISGIPPSAWTPPRADNRNAAGWSHLGGAPPPPISVHAKLTIEPWVVSPSGIAPEFLDEDAVRTVQRLEARGHEAYFVGGCVRDILLGRQPKDFDIATAARPQQVKRTFPRNCRIIGRRFKLAHLHFDGSRKILEVSTFRRTPEMSTSSEDTEEDLLITHDNEFGSAEEDALRRDFTVNALFFDPLNDRIIDYVGGMRDIEERVIRTIGEPEIRFREDPVRILRAAKFAGRLGFHLSPSTLEAMARVAPDLRRSAPPRVLEEILRLLRGGHALDSFQLLRDVGAIGVILPLVGEYLSTATADERMVFWRMLEALDGRVHAGDVPSAPVLLGAVFARPVQVAIAARPQDSPSTVAEELLGDLPQTLRLPRRDVGCLKRICGVQPRFEGREKRFRPGAFARDPFFKAALELYELACLATGTDLDHVADWTESARAAEALAPSTTDEALEEGTAEAMVADEGGEARGKRRRRRRRRNGRERSGTQQAPGHDLPRDRQEEGSRAHSPRADRRGPDRGRERGPDRESEQRPTSTPAARSTAAPGAPATSQTSSHQTSSQREGGADDARRKRRRGRRGGAGDPRRGTADERGGAAPPSEEAAEFDRSIFAQPLDPKDVPTFGALVEGGKGQKRRRPPKITVEQEFGDPYRPPPARSDSDGPPPPPPPPPADHDTFGDW